MEENGDGGVVRLAYLWRTLLEYSNIWLPITCGLLITHLTWLIVYLDSKQPGIQPPSPLSPSRYKLKSGHSFHLNYVFALLIGVLLALYMYWKGISIQY